MAVPREIVNCQFGGQGTTLLHTAVDSADKKAVLLLLEAGARWTLLDGGMV